MSQLQLNDDLVLSVKDLSIQFGGLKAVDGLNFDIKKGEIFGLIGPNGAGKTTVFNCITQFYKPNTGEILFRTNKDEVIRLTEYPVHEIISHGLVRTFQNVELVRELSIIENVLVGGHIQFKTSLVSQMFNTKKVRQEEERLREEAHRVLKILEIDELADELVAGQPYGVLKKVEMARTILSNPKLIILDEPAAGLNDVETIQLSKMIQMIRDDLGCSILLVEHDMRLVMDICDTICAISFGKHLATGNPEQIQNNKDVQSAYLGTEEDAYE